MHAMLTTMLYFILAESLAPSSAVTYFDWIIPSIFRGVGTRGGKGGSSPPAQIYYVLHTTTDWYQSMATQVKVSLMLSCHPEIRLAGDRVECLVKHHTYCGVHINKECTIDSPSSIIQFNPPCEPLLKDD